MRQTEAERANVADDGLRRRRPRQTPFFTGDKSGIFLQPTVPAGLLQRKSVKVTDEKGKSEI
jgi:hypothetical protein